MTRLFKCSTIPPLPKVTTDKTLFAAVNQPILFVETNKCFSTQYTVCCPRKYLNLFCRPPDNHSASSEEETRKEAVNIDTWLHRKDVIASFRCHQIIRNGFLTPRYCSTFILALLRLFWKVQNSIDLVIRHCYYFVISIVSNGNRTEWSPIRSVTIRVITKSDDCATGVRFVYHEYDYRPNWTTRSPITN